MNEELRAENARIRGNSDNRFQEKPKGQAKPQDMSSYQIPPEVQAAANLLQEFLKTENGKEVLSLFNSEFELFVNARGKKDHA